IEGHDHRSFGGQIFAVIPGHSAGATSEPAAVNPDHDRATVIGIIGTRPDICIETVFAARRLTCRSRLRRWRGLSAATTAAASLSGSSCNARRSECVRLSYPFPFRHRLRRTPSVLAKRRRRKGDALEDAHARLARTDGACEQATFDPYLFRNH